MSESTISTIDWVEGLDVSVDAPLDEVWSLFNDMGRWYTDYTIEQISGPDYFEAGPAFLENQQLVATSSKRFVRTPNSERDPDEAHPIPVKIIKVVPGREIVSLLTGSAYDWTRFTAFYIWTLEEQGTGTSISIRQYGEAEFEKPLTPDELRDYKADLRTKFNESWSNALANLAGMLAGEGAVA